MREPARETEASMYSASFNHEARSVPLILLSLQACSLAWSGVEQSEPSVPAVS